MSRSENRVQASSPPAGGVYNSQFWLAFVANFVLTTGNSLMFRFAELVAFLGGSEEAAGTIVGTGLFGVLLIRLVLGQGIDRYGERAIWTISSLLFILGSASFLWCHDVSVGLYVARTIYSIGVAGMFTCSVVHIQNMVPLHRRTEAIAALGTSGFVGMVAGTSMGDWIFAIYPLSEARFRALFGTVAAFGVVYLGLIAFLTRSHIHIPPRDPPPAFRLLVHYWPGSVVIIAMTLGMGLGVTTVFLTRFATERGIPGLHTFFTVYAVVALIFRLQTAQWAKTIGRHKTILLGLAGNIVGQAALPFVTRDWHFLVPAACCGFGHALLYPAIVSLGAGAFPRAYRGLGTTLVMGFTELGTAISPPLLGWIIDRYGYDPMFFSAAGIGLIVAIYYAITKVRQPDNDNDPEPAILFDDEAILTSAPDATPAT